MTVVKWKRYFMEWLKEAALFSLIKKVKACMCLVNEKSHADEYAIIEPFLGPNMTRKTSTNMYIGVKKKLTNQHPLTNRDKKSSLNTWNKRNSLPKKPALYGKPAKLKQTPKRRAATSKEYR